MDTENQKTVSRQRRWQIKKKQQGGCTQCGCPKDGPYSSLCVSCAKKKTVSARKQGHGEWKEGCRGRPPKWAKTNKDN